MPLLTVQEVFQAGDGYPRYEQIAKAITTAISTGRLRAGDRLPTVRQVAAELKVSMTTVSSAFGVLSDRGLIRAEIGRGTFVADRATSEPETGPVHLPRFVGGHLRRHGGVPWRRRVLANSAARLRASYPNAVDCSTGRPDPNLLPLELIRCQWKDAFRNVTSRDLQYATPEPIEELSLQVTFRLNEDAIPVRSADLMVGSSAQQFLALAVELMAGLWGPENVVIAVEQPGYPTIFDTWERAGGRLIGMAVDDEGVVPQALDTALRQGAKAALFTPRAHNPTGASWSVKRTAQLAAVLAEYPQAIAIEDDQFGGVARHRPGSLLGDPRIEDRVLYIRSFSKSIAPDLRVAIAAARPRLRALLSDAKSHADGWTSRVLQRLMARILAAPELDACLKHARQEYQRRREAAANVLNTLLAPNLTSPGCDGVNLWVHLPSSVDATEVTERAASLGVLLAPGEPFFLSPGRSDLLRFNAGSVGADQASSCAKILVNAILSSGRSAFAPVHV